MDKNRTLSSVIHPIHEEGRIFVAISLIITAIAFWFMGISGFLGFIVVAFCVYFFRDPERFIPSGNNLVLSPADGKVLTIDSIDPPSELELEKGGWNRIAIFLSVFDVHVNRYPINGSIKKIRYRPGKFFNASLDKSSNDNERNAIFIKSENDEDVVVVQIAGLVARRIVCNGFQNEQVSAGGQMGIIRFGSRVEIYIPDDFVIKVKPGQTMIGGETVIANLNKNRTINNDGEHTR